MSERLPEGWGVLVTRPQQQAGELVAEIEARGGTAHLFPSIEILPRAVADIESDAELIGKADITIYISSNAVQYGLPYASGRIAAIGPSTAAAIVKAGQRVAIQPADGFDSEALLAEKAFQNIAGKTVRIIRGNAGREKLASELRRRGAIVDYLSTYTRTLPSYPDEALDELDKYWQDGQIQAVVVMSVESWNGLHDLLSDAGLHTLARTTLVSPASRVLKEVQNRYPECPVELAAGPQSSDIVDCLVRVAKAGQSASQPAGKNE